MGSDMHSFLTEYYSSVVLALYANRCRVAQVFPSSSQSWKVLQLILE
jgi:hypothetical protein